MTLSVMERKILEQNYVVYDPWTMEKSQDFDKVAASQVILIAESHHSITMHKTQELLLKHLVKPSMKAQLLVEIAPIGVEYEHNQYPYFQDLPENLSISGSDIRKPSDEDKNFRLNLMKNNAENLSLAFRQEKKREGCYKKIADIVNQLLANKKGTIHQDAFVLPEVTYKEFQSIIKEIEDTYKEEEKLEHDLKSEYKIEDLDLDIEDSDLDLLKSNLGLTQEISKKLTTADKVLAIWGRLHFLLNDQLYTELNRNQVTFSVLLPNENLEDQAERDRQFRGIFPLPRSGFKFQYKFKENAYRWQIINIPMCYKQFFEKAVQNIMVDPKVEEDNTITHTPESLVDALSHKSNLTVPKDIIVKFQNFNSMKLVELKEYSRDQTLNDEENQELGSTLSCFFNSIFIFYGLKVDVSFPAGLHLKNIYRDMSIGMSSSAPWSIQVSSDPHLITRLDNLLINMVRNKKQDFVLGLGKSMIFTDLSVVKRDEILKNPGKEFLSWLGTKILSGYRLTFGGNASLGKGVVQSNGSNVEGLAMHAETQVTLTLSKKDSN